MAFDVSWFAVHSFGLDKAPVLLSSLDRKGIVTTAERDWKSELSLERVSVLEFLLQVHGSEDQDFGNYYCSVTPWVKSPTGSWQKEAEIYSKPIFVTVKMDVLNAFKYPLLIGVGLSTVIGLLSCLIGWDLALSLLCMSSPERGHVYQHMALLPTALSGRTITNTKETSNLPAV